MSLTQLLKIAQSYGQTLKGYSPEELGESPFMAAHMHRMLVQKNQLQTSTKEEKLTRLWDLLGNKGKIDERPLLRRARLIAVAYEHMPPNSLEEAIELLEKLRAQVPEDELMGV